VNQYASGVALLCTWGAKTLVLEILRAHTLRMRALALVLVAAAFLFGIYQFYGKKMPTTDQGTAPTQAISLAGVRADLLQIAQAERGSIALNGHCSSLDDLISSGSLTMGRSERDGYSYQIECSASEFQVVAKHPPAPVGSPIRYPTLAMDSHMEVREVQP
jgi:hypothetical protein